MIVGSRCILLLCLLSTCSAMSTRAALVFAHDSKGLHFGVRKRCVPHFASDEALEPCGVTLLDEYIDVVDNAVAGLKHPKPDISDALCKDYLNGMEEAAIVPFLDDSHPEFVDMHHQGEGVNPDAPNP